MNIVFMGTPEFASKTLEKVIKSKKHKILAVFTKPDKVNKRGNKVEFSSVKKLALEEGIEVHQPQTLKSEDVQKNLLNLNPDLILVVAYGKILPKEILSLPKYGCVNLHGSLLPKYRGSAPIQRAVLNSEKETGVTTMFMDEGMDTGDILLKEKIKIEEEDSSKSLFKKLAEVGSELVLKTLDLLEKGLLQRTKQKDEEATYAPPLSKEEAKISWKKMDAKKIDSLVKCMDAGPVAYTTLNGKRLKIFKSRVLDVAYSEIDHSVGVVVSEEPFTVLCKNNTLLEILELQAENKRKMGAKDFLLGNKMLGKKLGT